MKHILAALALLSGPVLADGAVTVALPDLSVIGQEAVAPLLAQIVNVTVISQNCPGVVISDGEYALLSGSADQLAARLKLSDADYDAQYWDPAFALLDQNGSCDGWAPVVPTIIDTLEALGGSTQPAK